MAGHYDARKVRNALNYLSRKTSGGVLQLDDLIPEATSNGETNMRSARDIPLGQVLINTYRSPIRLFVTGSGEIASTEGTTQGDPLAMAMYALAISPLINKLKQLCPDVKQVWYADDATGASTCTKLRHWWDELSTHAPLFGYYPNPP